MWLLDANMAVQLAEVLASLGIKCDTARRRGWQALQNGELVAALVHAGFTCSRLEQSADSANSGPRNQLAVILPMDGGGGEEDDRSVLWA